MERILLAGILLVSSAAHTEIVADKSSVFFCHNKRKTVETIVLANKDLEARQLNFSMTWEDGFTAKIDNCEIRYPRSCDVALQPGEQIEVHITVDPLIGGEQYGDLKITDQSSQRLVINLGASDFGGCWEGN